MIILATIYIIITPNARDIKRLQGFFVKVLEFEKRYEL